MTVWRRLCPAKKREACRKAPFFVEGRIFGAPPAHTFGMIKQTRNIQDVKQMVKAYDKRRVAVRVNLGRNKIMHFCGAVSGVYPSLFTVCPDEKDFLGKTSYSYADVLCGAVTLKPIS